MADATLKGDYKVIIDYTYPDVVAQAGGSEAMMKLVSTVFAQIKEQGMAIKSIVTETPGELVPVGEKLFCLVPQNLSMTVPKTALQPKGTLSSGSHMLAVSSDKGASWYFINSGSMTEEAVYKIFPELKGKLTLPKPGAYKFTPDN